MTPCFPPTSLNHINVAMKNFIRSYRQPSSRTTGTNAKSASVKSYSLTNTSARRICLHNSPKIKQSSSRKTNNSPTWSQTPASSFINSSWTATLLTTRSSIARSSHIYQFDWHISAAGPQLKGSFDRISTRTPCAGQSIHIPARIE